MSDISLSVSYIYGLPDIEKIAGTNIRKARIQKGMTQGELAELAGLGRTHLYRLEAGTQSMTLRTLQIIADALGVTARSLLTER